jgi:ornithine cyclodeaminase/alanine dehydrogenase-like protein (mu-crystallin family)
LKTLILSAKDVEKYVDAELAIQSVDYVFTQFGKGNINMPPKINVDMSEIGHESWCNAMPAYIVEQKIGGIKWVGGFGENQRMNLPYIMGVIMLTDPMNGHTVAIMDGRRISDLRTGASAAVFARYLTVDPLKGILIVGAGVQGKAAADCLLLEYPGEPIMFYDLDPEKTKLMQESFPADVRDRIIPVDDLEKAARMSKLIILLTTAKQPFMKNEWVSAGATMLTMGTYQQAFDDFALSVDKIIPDNLAQARHRGDLKPLFAAGKLSDKDCYAEIGEIAAGITKGRENDTERILGIPVGIGAHDVCIAHQVYEAALKNQDGVLVELQ